MPIVRKVPPPLVPDPIPQKFTRDEAIARLLAQGLTLADIQAEEEQVAANHAVALLRARYWDKPAAVADRFAHEIGCILASIPSARGG